MYIGDPSGGSHQVVRSGRGQDLRASRREFEAHFHEMLYIVGPSGSGKTTLLSIISGILRPNAGR